MRRGSLRAPSFFVPWPFFSFPRSRNLPASPCPTSPPVKSLLLSCAAPSGVYFRNEYTVQCTLDTYIFLCYYSLIPYRGEVRGVKVGEIIRRKRTDAGYSLRRFAQKCPMSPTFLSDIELGKSTPSLAMLELIACNLGISAGELLGGNPTSPSGERSEEA